MRSSPVRIQASAGTRRLSSGTGTSPIRRNGWAPNATGAGASAWFSSSWVTVRPPSASSSYVTRCVRRKGQPCWGWISPRRVTACSEDASATKWVLRSRPWMAWPRAGSVTSRPCSAPPSSQRAPATRLGHGLIWMPLPAGGIDSGPYGSVRSTPWTR